MAQSAVLNRRLQINRLRRRIGILHGRAFKIGSPPWGLVPLALDRRSGGGDAVDQIDQAVIVDAGVMGQADLAGAAGGYAFLADLHRVLQAAQRVGIQLGSAEAFVAGKATAVDAFRHNQLLRAAADDVEQALGFAQVLGAAGDVHGHGGLLRGECQAFEQMLANEFHWVVQFQSWVQAVLQQTQGAGAGVAVDGIEAATTGFEQGVDQLLALAVSLFGVAFGGEWLAAAKVVQVVREYHLEAAFFQ